MRTPAVAMERGVDNGGGTRRWRWRGDWVMALEVARACSLEFGFGEAVVWIWGNGLDL